MKEVRNAIDKSKALYGLYEFIDPTIGLDSTAVGSIDKFVDLAMKCVEDAGANRPAMSDVVKEIESLLLLVGSNPMADSASTSASYEEVSKGSSHHPYSNEFSDSGGVFPNPKIAT